jgi:hypothetical protein
LAASVKFLSFDSDPKACRHELPVANSNQFHNLPTVRLFGMTFALVEAAVDERQRKKRQGGLIDRNEDRNY